MHQGKAFIFGLLVLFSALNLNTTWASPAADYLEDGSLLDSLSNGVVLRELDELGFAPIINEQQNLALVSMTGESSVEPVVDGAERRATIAKFIGKTALPLALATSSTIYCLSAEGQTYPADVSANLGDPHLYDVFFFVTPYLVRAMDDVCSWPYGSGIYCLGFSNRMHIALAFLPAPLIAITEIMQLCAKAALPAGDYEQGRQKYFLCRTITKSIVICAIAAGGGMFVYSNSIWLKDLLEYEAPIVLQQFDLKGAIKFCNNAAYFIGMRGLGALERCSADLLQIFMSSRPTSLPWSLCNHYTHVLPMSQIIAFSAPIVAATLGFMFWIALL
jgi:hypothetical protein